MDIERDYLVVGVVSDDPFAIAVAHRMGQEEGISDVISLKSFANSEFCPRFISDERDLDHIGERLAGKTVFIVSTCCGDHTRNSLAMRTCLVARAAKDNGADRVILVEPDLFYSAQDRGPRQEHSDPGMARNKQDYKKFDGQPFSALLYATLLKTSGVDTVVTVHNHSEAVQHLFAREFSGNFTNLCPSELYAYHLARNPIGPEVQTSSDLVICAPDEGAMPFAKRVHSALGKMIKSDLFNADRSPGLLLMKKERLGERKVDITAAPGFEESLKGLAGKTVVVLDDMVRTGNTIVECCRILKDANAGTVAFVVTHFYSSEEVKENLNDRAIDEIITTNTLPQVLNRDMQGRLRGKMLVLKIEKWIANFLLEKILDKPISATFPPFTVDASSRNPHYKWIQKQQGQD